MCNVLISRYLFISTNLWSNHQLLMFDTSKEPVRKIYIGSEIDFENNLFLAIYTKKVPKKCRILYQSHICRTILNRPQGAVVIRMLSPRAVRRGSGWR